MTRNSRALASFVAYCESHPEQRFWQALRNWSKWSFIYGSNVPPWEANTHPDFNEFHDTFYLEGLNGTRKEGETIG